ncbi:winged helix DNA-binding domain-containing protein [Ruania halotolerans]|uniref:winged helix DNA-binding domain-containing protein n=1 Tax=Ruania halotolerans TaxID=2897773 RepID=UPI001E624F6F|nr:winged helix DNA-binding domain-containing protein [Ruania halotolerans]UFU06266.1 winged helix DNA-binding domain-containing protein [Ruania halotolerans]
MAWTHDLPLLRLLALGLAGPRPASPAEAVRHLGAVQAQDLPGALTSIALRTGGTCEDVRDALDAGAIVRTWSMRGTLHLVPAEDAQWMTAITGPRTDAAAAKRHADLGIDEIVRARALEIATRTLDGRSATRTELFAQWQEAGLLADRQSAVHLLGLFCRAGELVLGPLSGTEQLVVRCRDWIPDRRTLDVEDGLDEWLLRYVDSHGPVTERDAARWLGLPLGMIRASLSRTADRVERLEAAGETYLLHPGLPDLLTEYRQEARRLMLLPGFDEFMLGYGDRTFAVPPDQLDRLVPGGNGVFRATIVKGGRVIGLWRRGRTAQAAVEVEPFRPLGPRVEASVHRAFAGLP